MVAGSKVDADTLLPPYRVLELAGRKGELCGKLLADLGADVIEIEPPGGSPTRDIGPFVDGSLSRETSLHWLAHNTNKRGVTLNLESSDARDIFKRLAGSADCIIETLAPGRMEAMGLGYDELSRANPALVVTSITDFGQAGPYRDFKASDLAVQALTGLMGVNGERNRPPVRWSMDQTYSAAAFHALAGTVVALNCRDLSGKGQQVDISVEDAMAWQNLGAWFPLHWEFEKIIMQRDGNRSRRGQVSIHTAYRCLDGFVSFRLWTGSMGRRTRTMLDYMEARGFYAGELQAVDWDSIDFLKVKQEEIDGYEAQFSRFFMEHTKKELYEDGARFGYILYPVSTPSDILHNPQLLSQEHFILVEQPGMAGPALFPGKCFNSTGVGWKLRSPAPAIGEHNQQVYGDLGLSARDIVALAEAGIV